MHRLLHIIAIAALVMLLSCRHAQGPSRGLLDRAEALTPSRPDSALALLESIPATSLHPGEETALHALLLTQARYKCLYDDTDDSLIRIATSWYDTHRDTRRRMLANFYLGYILMNRGSYGESVRHMLLAEDLATQLRDTFQMAMANNYLSKIHSDNYNHIEELGYAKKAASLMQSIRDDGYAIEAKRNLAISYNNNFNPQAALQMAEEVISDAKAAKDTFEIVKGLAVMSKSLIQARKYHEALDLLRTINLDYKAYSEGDELYNMVFCAICVNDIDLADSLVNSIGGHSCPANAVPDQYWMLRGRYDRAYNSLEKQAACYDSLFRTLSSQEVNTGEVEYRKQLIIESDRKRQRSIMYSIGVTCALICMAVYFIATDRVRKAKLMEFQAIVGNLTSEKNSLVNKYFSQSQRLVENSKVNASNLKKQLESDIEDFCQKSESELLKTAEAMHPGLYGRFCETYREVSEKDKKMFLYYLCGISTVQIGVFLGCNLSSVYTRKSRLKEKVKLSDSRFKEEFLRILS